MGAVSIGDRFVLAFVWALFEPLVHSPDVLARFPEAIGEEPEKCRGPCGSPAARILESQNEVLYAEG